MLILLFHSLRIWECNERLWFFLIFWYKSFWGSYLLEFFFILLDFYINLNKMIFFRCILLFTFVCLSTSFHHNTHIIMLSRIQYCCTWKSSLGLTWKLLSYLTYLKFKILDLYSGVSHIVHCLFLELGIVSSNFFKRYLPIGFLMCLLLLRGLLLKIQLEMRIWMLILVELMIWVMVLHWTLIWNTSLLIFPEKVWMIFSSWIISGGIMVYLLEIVNFFNCLKLCYTIHGKMRTSSYFVTNGWSLLYLSYMLSSYVHFLKSPFNLNHNLIFYLYTLSG